MKRVFILFMVAVMLLSFTACGNNKETATKKCWNCDQAVSDTAAFCANCGSAVASNSDLADFFMFGTDEGNSGETDSRTTETTEATKPLTTTRAYVDNEKIKIDLIAEDQNCFFINNQDTYLNIDSVEILRRKSDTDYDEVHIAAVFSDTCYVVNAEYILYYSYYDVGGWCLDDYLLSDYESKARANPVSNSEFITFMQNYFSSCSITNRDQRTDDSGVYTDTIQFNATLEYSYLSINFSGWYTMQFYNDCWYDTYDFWIVNYDWSAFKNTFQYKDNSINLGTGFYSADVKITISDIEQVGEKELSVTYSADVYLYDKTGGYIEKNEKIEEKTKKLTLHIEHITILGREIEIPRDTGYIMLPWYGTFAVFLCRDNGVEATDNTTYGKTFAHFNRVISNDELQDAIDRLENLNP